MHQLSTTNVRKTKTHTPAHARRPRVDTKRKRHNMTPIRNPTPIRHPQRAQAYGMLLFLDDLAVREMTSMMNRRTLCREDIEALCAWLPTFPWTAFADDLFNFDFRPTPIVNGVLELLVETNKNELSSFINWLINLINRFWEIRRFGEIRAANEGGRAQARTAKHRESCDR